MATYTKSMVKHGANSTHTDGSIQMVANQTLRIDNRLGNRIVKAIKGTLWVTLQNDPKDYILHTGETLPVNRRGAVVVEAMTDSWLQLL